MPSAGENNNAVHAFAQEDARALTPDQQEALGAMQEFVGRGKEKCFLLEGYAGTGKTFLIRRLAQWLEERQLSCMLAAPTGRAAKVLTDKTGFLAGTIHRSIYSMDKLEEIPNARAQDRFKFFYALKLVASDERPRVIIVDESSMVSDVESDEKFIRFGSGRLLKDLMEFAGELQPDSKCQIVFVGDPAQLPPVGMNSSPALDGAYLKREFDAESCGASLKQVVRQGGDSAILAAATQIREDIERGRLNRLEICPDGREIVAVDRNGVMDLWAREIAPDREPSVAPPLVCVTWTNATALQYNAAVRARLHGGGDGLHALRPRDYLMVVANNRATGLMNGELVLVKSLADESETHHVGIRGRDGPTQVSLTFRKLTLAVPDARGEVSLIESMILENVLFGRERDMTEDEFIAQQVFFKSRHAGLPVKSEAFKMALAEDPYFNALRVKFGYAVTCHKAQGGEWPSAVVVFERGRPCLESLRWTYTAITRAKKALYGVGLPRYRLVGWEPEDSTVCDVVEEAAGDDGAEPLEERVEEGAAEMADDSASSVDLDAFHAAGFPPELDWYAPRHFAAVAEWGAAGIRVERVDAAPTKHYVRYALAREGKTATLQVYYRANKRLTPQPAQSAGLGAAEELAKACDAAFERAGQGGRATEEEPAELRELREMLVLPALERLGGTLLGVEHLPYRERYRCRSASGGLAAIDFCYNGRREFRRRPEIQTATTDADFANAIVKEIEK